MAETKVTWGDVMKGVGVTFREFYTQNDMNQVHGWDPVVKVLRSNDLTTNFSGKTGAGLLTRFADGSAIPSANRFKLFDTSVESEPYGSRLEVTRQTLLFRDFNSVFSEAKDLMASFQSHLSHAAAQVFNRAFTAGTGVTGRVRVTPYADGSPLASVSHPRADGGTAQSNASSTSIPLTESNLEVGRIALLNQLQDDGVPMMAPGQLYLVVPINLEKTARIITESQLRSGTGNNDVNIYSGGAVKVLSSNWLDSGNSGSSVGSNTAWFLTAPNVSKLAVVLSSGPELDFLKDKDTKSGIFDIIADLAVCSYDWHGVYASQGNNAAYAL